MLTSPPARNSAGTTRTAAKQFGKTWPVKLNFIIPLAVAGAVLLVTGCQSLFSGKNTAAASRWQSYAQAESDFEKIVPGQTGTAELKGLGFHPAASPNIKLLTYIDVIHIFMPHPGIRREDLPKAVQDCIDAREQSCAYLIELDNIQARRHGNLALDIFGFKRRTHETGWRFHGLVLVNNGVAVYKLSSGEPQISRDEKVFRPLGPLQEMDGAIVNVVKLPH
jgi:hypothetical protein